MDLFINFEICWLGHWSLIYFSRNLLQLPSIWGTPKQHTVMYDINYLSKGYCRDLENQRRHNIQYCWKKAWSKYTESSCFYFGGNHLQKGAFFVQKLHFQKQVCPIRQAYSKLTKNIMILSTTFTFFNVII